MMSAVTMLCCCALHERLKY